MRIVLCGYGRAGKESLEHLLQLTDPCNILVFTHNRDDNKSFLHALNLSGIAYSTHSINKEIPLLRTFQPDYLISAYYRHIITDDVLEVVAHKAMNLHPSLLPDYKGCFSSVWAIINGEEITGCTFHYITNSIDAGNILLQKSIPISENDTAYSLYNTLIDLFMRNFIDAVTRLLQGDEGTIQDIHGRSRYYKREVPFNGVINSKEVTFDFAARFVRAMHFPPHPAARIRFDTEEVEVKDIRELLPYRERFRQ